MMTRGIWTKWIIGAAIGLIIVAIGCILYYQYTTAPYKAEADKDDKLLQQWKANKAKTPTTADKELPNTPAESTENTAEKPTNNIGEETKTNTDKSTEPVNIATPEQENTEEVEVSPFGFGPYPEVPADFIGGERHWEIYTDPEHELLDRVWIKLWKQGIKAEGITTERNGLFYPIIKGVAYVEYDTFHRRDGSTERYISDLTGHPDDFDFHNDLGDNPEDYDVLYESDIPSHITIYTYPDGGIDPYQFLDLPKE